jgi:hypothetical protein
MLWRAFMFLGLRFVRVFSSLLLSAWWLSLLFLVKTFSNIFMFRSAHGSDLEFAKFRDAML